jgi:hypothetical protein
VVNDGVEQLVMEEKTTVPIEEANAPSAFVEDVQVVERRGRFAFELRVGHADDEDRASVPLLVYPLPDGGYRSSEAAGGL